MFKNIYDNIPNLIKITIAIIILALLIPYFGLFSSAPPLPSDFDETVTRRYYED